MSASGTANEWIWSGTAFQMITSKAMPDCKDVPRGDRPTLFRAGRR